MFSKNLFSKVLKNYIFQSKKHFVSGDRDSRLAVLKRKGAKEAEKAKIRELELQNKLALAKKVEERFDTKYKTYLDKICETDKELANAKSKIPSKSILYYVPLKDEDTNFLNFFDESTNKLISEGGRITLYQCVFIIFLF